MMISVILLFSLLINPINSCFRTSPIVMPSPTPPPLPPCQRCPPLRKDELVKQTITIVNGCAVLTLTVTGVVGAPTGELTWNNVNVIAVALPGAATLVTQCNAAGSAFEYMGTPVTRADGAIY